MLSITEQMAISDVLYELLKEYETGTLQPLRRGVCRGLLSERSTAVLDKFESQLFGRTLG